MIKRLTLEHIGPAPKLEVEEFGPRLNVITGDNGLGKTFLLDACWYALTRTWADGKQFYPTPDVPKNDPPRMDYTIFDKEGNEVPGQANYNFATQTWRIPQTHLRTPGLVVYARVDGGFSVWDPFRNHVPDDLEIAAMDEGSSSTSSFREPERPPAFQFSSQQVWEGLEEDAEPQKYTFCNGFLRDVETWRLRGNGPFQLLQNVLKRISPSEEETLSLGEGVRVRVGDLKDIPTLKTPYGPVPVTQAAVGMRHVLALAYLLVWAWDEHVRAAQLIREEPTNRIVLLFDEVEAHLHPKWQRVFLPSLLEVVNSLLLKGQAAAVLDQPVSQPDQMGASPWAKASSMSIQIIATTHAPLVPASVEAAWDAQQDRLFDFNLVEGKRVVLKEIPFARQGSAANWLTSGSFDLPSSFAVAAEKAMGRADALMQQYPHAQDARHGEVEAVHNALKEALGGDDEYWPYWLPYYEAARRGR